MRITDIDTNFKIETNVKRDGLVFCDIDTEPFRIYGVFREGEQYRRLPEALATSERVNDGIAPLSVNTAGGRVRFVTDSPYVAIKIITTEGAAIVPHMTFSGTTGVDMYANFGEGERFMRNFLPTLPFTDIIEGVQDFGLDLTAPRTVTINLPLYNGVKKMYIGLHKDAQLLPPPDYAVEKPIVYYGSSITQGGCASRAGMSYEGIISRALDANFINLGFSGRAKGEAALAEYIAGLDMSAFVLDYDHNATTPEDLLATHKPFFDIIRAAQPTLPIIIMPKPRYYRYSVEMRRAGIVRATYDAAVAAGDGNVYFIDGPELMARVRDDATVDGVHPTDLGFMSMAEAIIPTLKRILNK